MGTLKMLHMKQCTGRSKAVHLKNALEYIFNPEKASGRWIGGNSGLSAEDVYKNMMGSKQTMGKEDGRQGYHYILTFLPGEVDEELAYLITQEFCEMFLGDAYQHTNVLHTDRAHYHSHIIFNSIDMNGRKYRYEKGDWAKKIQPSINQLCKKYGLSEIALEKEGDKKEKGKKKEGDFKKIEKEKKTQGKENEKTNQNPKRKSMKWMDARERFYDQVKEDIRNTIFQASSMEDFMELMKEKHYFLRKSHSKKHGDFILFRPEGKERGVRSYTLGAGYSPEDIGYQIKNKEAITLSDESFRKGDDWGKSYQRVYYHIPENLRKLFWKNTYLIRNWKGERLSLYPQMYKYRESLEALQKMEQSFQYIEEMGVSDIQEVKDKLGYITYKLKELGKLRYEVVNSDEMEDNVKQEKLLGITKTYKGYMKEKEILEEIQKREVIMQGYEKEIEKERLFIDKKKDEKSLEKTVNDNRGLEDTKGGVI